MTPGNIIFITKKKQTTVRQSDIQGYACLPDTTGEQLYLSMSGTYLRHRRKQIRVEVHLGPAGLPSELDQHGDTTVVFMHSHAPHGGLRITVTGD